MNHSEIRKFSIFQIWVFRVNFFLKYLVDFCPLDPDPESHNLADPTDPDPKHCLYPVILSFYAVILSNFYPFISYITYILSFLHPCIPMFFYFCILSFIYSFILVSFHFSILSFLFFFHSFKTD